MPAKVGVGEPPFGRPASDVIVPGQGEATLRFQGGTWTLGAVIRHLLVKAGAAWTASLTRAKTQLKASTAWTASITARARTKATAGISWAVTDLRLGTVQAAAAWVVALTAMRQTITGGLERIVAITATRARLAAAAAWSTAITRTRAVLTTAAIGLQAAITATRATIKGDAAFLAAFTRSQMDLTMDGAAGAAVVHSITRLKYLTGEILASKDSFVPTSRTLGNCNDNANKNGQDLRVSNAIAGENQPQAYFAFDLTALPDNATVTAARLTIRRNGGAGGGGTQTQERRISAIDSGGESWAETTITCSNAPAPTTPQQDFSHLDADGDIVITLSADWRTHIQNRMGSANTCTFVLSDTEAMGDLAIYESKDQGTGNAFGPRLEIEFTVPV